MGQILDSQKAHLFYCSSWEASDVDLRDNFLGIRSDGAARPWVADPEGILQTNRKGQGQVCQRPKVCSNAERGSGEQWGLISVTATEEEWAGDESAILSMHICGFITSACLRVALAQMYERLSVLLRLLTYVRHQRSCLWNSMFWTWCCKLGHLSLL